MNGLKKMAIETKFKMNGWKKLAIETKFKGPPSDKKQ